MSFDHDDGPYWETEVGLLSDTAEYALRAVLYIADNSEDGPVRVDTVAEALELPRNYLSKILHTLAKQGILRSTRGPAGGFQLAVPAEELTLQRIASVFDAIGPRRGCLLGRPECSDNNPCPAHAHWKGVAEQISRFFREKTVAELLREPAGAAAPWSY
ncbi:MAG TPA: Rrf2 family transcriptional regulator [Longimicrobiales bacterium]|nr:Rrf2 family transcriptional regulator [Longimicrobiales bacterium]